jgi:peptide chain release factor 1
LLKINSAFTARSAAEIIFSLKIIESRPGISIALIEGKNALKIFEKEAGGHRWQRVSPLDKRGRVHTSTITVAILTEPKRASVKIDKKDLEWKTCRGSGAGGQHRNVTDSAVQLKHIPTQISIRCESERSQHLNKDYALRLLRAKLYEIERSAASRRRSELRASQVGSGMRGDKIRTYQVQRDKVTDHRTGKTQKLSRFVKGEITI